MIENREVRSGGKDRDEGVALVCLRVRCGCRLRLSICAAAMHVFTVVRKYTLPFTEPDFVGSALVRESSGSRDGDDDKIYFFFSERALELDCDTELTVARVARVCKVILQNGSQQVYSGKPAKTGLPISSAVCRMEVRM